MTSTSSGYSKYRSCDRQHILKLTDKLKCSTAPRPFSPNTPNERLSSNIIGIRKRLRNST